MVTITRDHLEQARRAITGTERDRNKRTDREQKGRKMPANIEVARQNRRDLVRDVGVAGSNPATPTNYPAEKL